MESSTNIPQKLFFRIGEVCDLIKVQPHVLRYWETEFPMLSPQKNRAGQRVYRRKDVEMVLRIRNLLYEEKFTIAGARKKISEELRKGGAPRVKVAMRERAPDIDQQIGANFVNEKPDENKILENSHELQELPPFSVQPPIQTISNLPDEMNVSLQTIEPVAAIKTQRAIRFLQHNLEELLTLLNTDASIKQST